MNKNLLLLVVILFFGLEASAWVTLSQGNYRWRNDDGTLETATAMAAENTAATTTVGTNIRLRLEIYNLTTSIVSPVFQLQYSTDNSNWTSITNDAGNAFVLSETSWYNEANTINNYLTSSLPNFGGGYTIESSITKSWTFDGETTYEAEYCIKATSNADLDTDYYFQISEPAVKYENIMLQVSSAPPVPLSNSAILISLVLMTVFIVFSFYIRKF